MVNRRLGLRSFAGASSVLVLVSVGCSSRADIGSSRETAVLSIGAAAPAGTQDPGIAVLADLLQYESLVVTGNDGRILPNLAESWNRSPDGLSWTFELRKGTRFHDGAEVTAERVTELLTEAIRNPQTVAVAPSFQQVASVSQSGPSAFKITLTRPSALLLSDLASGGVNITHGSGTSSAGTGPFIVESRDDKRITMRRFEGFRGGNPAIQRIELNAFPTVRNAWAALMRGEIDFLYEVGPDASDFVSGESSVQTFTFLRSYIVTLGFNLKHPVLRSKEVRRALNRAIDRDAIVRAGFRGHGRPAQDPVWPQHWASSNATPRYTYNREAAALGFATAGYAARHATRGKVPSRFSFRCVVYQPLERIALMVQKQLYEIGVDMEIDLAGSGDLGRRLGTGNYDAYLYWLTTARSFTWPYLFWHSPEPGRPVFLQTGYSAADETLEQVRYAATDEEFRNAVAAFQKVIHDDPPAVFLAWEERMRAVSQKFEVTGLEPGRDVIASLWRWRPAEARTASRTR
jgi:peptide/nickel transport system substrate-binding protein